MQDGTDQSRDPSTATRIEGLQLSVEEMAAVKQGLTIALTKAHWERRSAHSQPPSKETPDPKPAKGTFASNARARTLSPRAPLRADCARSERASLGHMPGANAIAWWPMVSWAAVAPAFQLRA